ncbi:protein pxr1-like [Limosa lapponica baueri]|uniref:Protein pxr1-like n=1 Tax=Limosa lapponica baueri TaxID=1758121 RepID=A0A2I0U2Q5_LIMLA|nr:protein pxr1-like [Limosa lapponica baueri]
MLLRLGAQSKIQNQTQRLLESSVSKPVGNSDSASVITYLRKRGKAAKHQQQLERGVRICERNNCGDIKVSEERGGEGVPGARAEIFLQAVVKTMVRQNVHLQPMEVNGGADILRDSPAGAGKVCGEFFPLRRKEQQRQCVMN